MPLIFPRSRLTGKGTSEVEEKDVENPVVYFQKWKVWEGNKIQLSVFQGQMH